MKIILLFPLINYTLPLAGGAWHISTLTDGTHFRYAFIISVRMDQPLIPTAGAAINI